MILGIIVFDSRFLREALLDSVLAASGLPTIREARDLLSRARERVRLVITVLRDSVFSEEGLRRLEKLVKGYPVELEKRVTGEWPWKLPEPRIEILGRLSGRLVFYAVPSDVLLMPFYLSLAAAGGAWSPSTPARCPRGRVVLYVVPGLPCTKALYYSLPIVLHCEEAELWVVDAEEAIGQGYGIPSDRVPAFVAPSGRVKLYAPNSVDDALHAWIG